MALFLAGKDSSDIVTELTGMKSDAGKPYQKKLRQVQAVIRDELRRRQGKETV